MFESNIKNIKMSNYACTVFCQPRLTRGRSVTPFLEFPVVPVNDTNGDASKILPFKSSPRALFRYKCTKYDFIYSQALHSILATYAFGVTHICTLDISDEVVSQLNAELGLTALN